MGRMGWGKNQTLNAKHSQVEQGAELSVLNSGHKRAVGVRQSANCLEELQGQPPKAGQLVDRGADLWDTGQHSKLNCPTFLWEELTKQNCN
jgi:hypothetical protein